MLFVPGCRRDWKATIRDKVSIVRSVGGNGREVVFLRRMVAWALRWACIGQSHRQVIRQGPSCVLYPRFLASFPGLVTMSSIVINRTGFKRTAFSLFRACWSSGLPFPGLLVFGPSLSGLVGLRAFPFRACHHGFDRHKLNRIQANGIFITPRFRPDLLSSGFVCQHEFDRYKSNQTGLDGM